MGERSKIEQRIGKNLHSAHGKAVPRSAVFKESTGSTNTNTRGTHLHRYNQDLSERGLIAKSTKPYGVVPLSTSPRPFPTAEQLGITSTGMPVLYRMHSIAAQSCATAMPETRDQVLDKLYGDRETLLEDEVSAFHYNKNELNKLLQPHGWRYRAIPAVRVFSTISFST
jgi:hypothetical protein